MAKRLKRVKYLSKIGDFAENYSKLLKDLDFLVNNEKALLNPSRPNLVAIPFLSAGLKVGVGIKASIVKGEDMGLIDFTDSSAVLAHLTAL